MKLKVFSIYDSKAEAYLQPIYALATGAALRSFEAAANDEGHDFHRFAGDYTLFEIGTFDQHSGLLEILKAPINLGTALQFKSFTRTENP